MPAVGKSASMGKRTIKTLFAVSAAICVCELSGAGWSHGGGPAPPDTPTQQLTPISVYLVALPNVKDKDDARPIAHKFVDDYLKALSGRVKFVDEDYYAIEQNKCGDAGTCEVIQLIIEEQGKMVTYRIASKLLPQAPDRPIWNEREPLSCDIATDRPASQCVGPMLHVLANRVVAHDTNVHRPPQ